MAIHVETLLMEPCVLRVTLQRGRDIHLERGGINGKPAIVEQAIHIPPEQDATVLVVFPQLGAAGQVTRF